MIMYMYKNQSDVHFYFGVIFTYTMHIHAVWPSLSYNEVISYNVIVFRLHLRVNTHQQHSPSGQRVQLHIPTDMVCATCTCDLEIF